MNVEVACVHCKGDGPNVPLTNGYAFRSYDNSDNEYTPCQMYQQILHDSPADLIIYVHDDLTVYDTHWVEKIVNVFKYPPIVACGLGGATRLGSPVIYRKPYHISQLARFGYGDNQTNAEEHGTRIDYARQVAVLDAYCMAVDTEFLREVGGWPVENLTHHCLDTWLACQVARYSKSIWQVGCPCLHKGGGTSTKKEYLEAHWLQGTSVNDDHRLPHKWIYEEYRDVLPIVRGI